MSTLDQYKVEPSSFDRWYDRFLQNNFTQRRFRITLTSGETVEGIPTAGSIANPNDPNVSFHLDAGDGFYRIPFRALQTAEPL